MQQTVTQVEATARRPELVFRPDVEGLRALAILLVIFSHAGLGIFPSGFIGVDVFFVLSGYLITGLLLKEIRTTGSIHLARFYARRARRLLPAAMLLVMVVCLVEAVVIDPFEQYRVLKAAFATLVYSSNFYFAHVSEQYFNLRSAANPLLHTWSLAVEEQFYLVWPVVLLFLARTSKGPRTVWVALIATASVSFVFCIWYTGHRPMAAFYSSPARAWEFCFGALVTLVPATRLQRNSRDLSWLGAIGFAGLLVSAEWIPSSRFPGYVAVFPALCTIAILLAGAGAPISAVPRLLSTGIAQTIGGLSYSLYLWHWPALVVAHQLFPSGSLAVRLSAIAVASGLAVVTHRLVENPIRFHRSLTGRPGLTLKLAFAAACIPICALGAWRAVLLHSAQFQKYNRIAHDIPALYERGCESDLTEARPRLCSFGETESPRSTVVLFGDSHAAEWFPALEEITRQRHWKLVTIVKPGCTPLMLKDEPWPIMERVCAEWRRDSVDQIEALHPDVVVVSCASIHLGAKGKLETDAALWQEAARATFVALIQAGAQVRFIRDTPSLNYNVTECQAQAEWDGRTQCSAIDPAIALDKDIYAALQRGAAGLDKVRFIDLTDQMCSANECYTQIGDLVVYRDGDHLTATFARSLAGVLAKRLIDSEDNLQ